MFTVNKQNSVIFHNEVSALKMFLILLKHNILIEIVFLIEDIAQFLIYSPNTRPQQLLLQGT